MGLRIFRRLSFPIPAIVLFLAAVLYASCPQRAAAQFIGFTSPQTVTQAAFTAAACAADTFIVRNIGQSVHYVLYTTAGTITQLSIQIDGSPDGITFFRLSETANDVTAGGIFASIYLPVIRVNITSCVGSGTITALYTGTSVATGDPLGLFATTSNWNKGLAVGLPADTSATFTLPLPNGGTGGAVYFDFSDGTCAGSTLAVTAGPDATHLVTILPATVLETTGDQQAFTVPPVPANIAVITYITGCGGSAATYDLSFSVGDKILTSSTYTVLQGTTIPPPPSPIPPSAVSCDVQQTFDVTDSDEIITSAAGAGTRIRICHISFALGTAINLKITEGTGVDCATGPADLTGTYQNVSAIALDFGNWGPLTVATAEDNVCLDFSAASTGGGVVVYAEF